MNHVRPLLLSLGLLLVGAEAQAQTPAACAGVTQNQIQVQFVTALGITVDGSGRLTARDPARLTAAQRRELATLQALSGASWRSEVDPTTAAALRRQPADDPDAANQALDELLAFARITLGNGLQRGATPPTGTSFDALPVMPASLCARTTFVMRQLSSMAIVRRAYQPPLPAPPPGA